MREYNGSVLYSAKDLLNFLGCSFSTTLDLLIEARTMSVPQQPPDSYGELLKSKGIEHESRYLNKLRAEGRSTREIQRVESLEIMSASTLQAMRDGVDVIYQGALYSPPWHGYSDFLLRTDAPSALGGYSYTVADTKLARTAKPKHLVQLWLYSQLVALTQQVTPNEAHVVLGDGTDVALSLKDFTHYCDLVSERFKAFVTSERNAEAEPCPHCGECRWAQRCEHEWDVAGDLSLVARLGRTQRKKLRAAGVKTIGELAALPADRSVPKLQPQTLTRLREQARLQIPRRGTGESRVEVLSLEDRRGFARLPQSNAGDLFFDMEGDPLYSAAAGLEYLFGFHYMDGGAERFTPFWAKDTASEKHAFEKAVDFIVARLAEYPAAFVYHYASYEVSALKRLAQQHGTRENEIDNLLRGRKLVDLYKVAREGVRTSEPGYSLKDLEVFFAPERTEAITEGGESIVAFERWLNVGDDALLQQIEAYNAFDCRSTRLCRDWLVSLRPAEVGWFEPAAEDAVDAEARKAQEEKRGERETIIHTIQDKLVADATEKERPWREMLGHLLEYHRREARSEWWRYFERQDSSDEELVADSGCVGGLEADPERPPRKEKRSHICTFRFPDQELKVGARDHVVRAGTEETFEVVSLNEQERRLELKVGPSRSAFPDVFSLIPPGPRDDGVQRDAILRYAEAVLDGREREYAAVGSILRRDRPRLKGGAILNGATDLLRGTVDAVSRMESTHLVIQGPPGSGKTFTSAHAIVDLLGKGMRVGVASQSHKAINNLLYEVESVSLKRGFTFNGVKKSSSCEQELNGEVIVDTLKTEIAESDEYQLIGGTAWLFSRPKLDRQLDYLFIDESGQVSLANVVAMGVSAKNIVLVGDQMQLSQPVKGAHPGGSGVSALDHLMGDWATVPTDRGIFLDRTFRMHPNLCRFVSEAFYDGRLAPDESTARQRLVLETHDDMLAPAGLRFVALEHEDNSQKSLEEAVRLNEVYHELLGQSWIDTKGKSHVIGGDDILVVSPYNMQVNLLAQTLPAGARVGTVDKFQGQQAAVVLISMASSSYENAPRGIEFLFSRNRLNVAISRARCLAVIFASPRLLETPCKGIEEMKLVNALCWARAYARTPDRGFVAAVA